MDTQRLISDLLAEREKIDQAITVLRSIDAGRPRRGRRPAWMKQIEAQPQPKRRGRPPGSANRPKESAVA